MNKKIVAGLIVVLPLLAACSDEPEWKTTARAAVEDEWRAIGEERTQQACAGFAVLEAEDAADLIRKIEAATGESIMDPALVLPYLPEDVAREDVVLYTTEVVMELCGI